MKWTNLFLEKLKEVLKVSCIVINKIEYQYDVKSEMKNQNKYLGLNLVSEDADRVKVSN